MFGLPEIRSKKAQVSKSKNNFFALSEMQAISNNCELMFFKLLQSKNAVISENGTATGSGPHRVSLEKEKDIDSVPAKMQKKLPRRGQFDLQRIYSDFFCFQLSLTLHGSVENKEKQHIWFYFARMWNALANKTSSEFNLAFERLPILKPSISI